MIKILTNKGHRFLTEFSALLEKYNVLFTMNKQGEIDITIFEGNEGNEDKTDITRTSIHFQNDFDENDIKDLLEENQKLILLLIEENQTPIISPATKP